MSLFGDLPEDELIAAEYQLLRQTRDNPEYLHRGGDTHTIGWNIESVGTTELFGAWGPDTTFRASSICQRKIHRSWIIYMPKSGDDQYHLFKLTSTNTNFHYRPPGVFRLLPKDNGWSGTPLDRITCVDVHGLSSTAHADINDTGTCGTFFFNCKVDVTKPLSTSLLAISDGAGSQLTLQQSPLPALTLLPWPVTASSRYYSLNRMTRSQRTLSKLTTIETEFIRSCLTPSREDIRDAENDIDTSAIGEVSIVVTAVQARGSNIFRRRALGRKIVKSAPQGDYQKSWVIRLPTTQSKTTSFRLDTKNSTVETWRSKDGMGFTFKPRDREWNGGQGDPGAYKSIDLVLPARHRVSHSISGRELRLSFACVLSSSAQVEQNGQSTPLNAGSLLIEDDGSAAHVTKDTDSNIETIQPAHETGIGNINEGGSMMPDVSSVTEAIEPSLNPDSEAAHWISLLERFNAATEDMPPGFLTPDNWLS